MRLKVAWFSAFGCIVIATMLADAGVKMISSKGSEQRRLIIRSGTLFTKDGVPIQLSGFDSEIESDPAPSGANISRQIKAVIVRSGSAFLRAQDLSKLLQTRIRNNRLSDLAVETSGNEMKISGSIRKALRMHFEIRGPVSLTKNGWIDLHESSMKVDKLPMKGLSEMLGMDPGHLIGNDARKGIQAGKEDILFDPNTLWGMSVQGRLTEVKVIKDGLMLVYGGPRPRS